MSGPAPLPEEPVEVVAGRFQLRPWEDRHVDAVLAAAADPEIRRWNEVAAADRAAALNWIEHRRTWGTHASWAVHDTTGAVLGSVSIHQVDVEQSDAEIGYWVLPAARGAGVATAAVSAAARFGFGALGLHRLELFHAIENPASCAVALGAGFRHEGTHRQSYRYGDGEYHDEHSHGRLASDAEPVRPA